MNKMLSFCGLFFMASVLFVVTATASAPLRIVDGGTAKAVILTAEDPSPIAIYAVKELVEHVERATGVTLPVGTERDPIAKAYPFQIFVGVTEAARTQDIDATALGPDVFVLRSVGNALYVLGAEDHTTNFLHHSSLSYSAGRTTQNSYRGTLFGVYEVLERALGVRWLWPGELGTYVPRTDTVVFEGVDEVVKPALSFRRFRTWGVGNALRSYDPDRKRLAFSDEGLQNYADALFAYFARHRMGDSEPKPMPGHYFEGWWRRHGERNPEWFMQREDGERGPPPSASPRQLRDVAMCVSNPDLHRYLVEHAWDGGPVLRLGEVDLPVYCHCDDCMAWDGPQIEGSERITSDRYARFWKAVHTLAKKINPDVTVVAFLYMHYFPEPSADIQLNKNIHGDFCPWGGGNTVLYPNTEERLEWQRRQWLGWARTGISMGYRPNHTLTGYVMPHINTRQAGEFFRFAYEHGMVGADLDSLIGQWAIRGLQDYMYFRLFVNPRQTIESIRAEFLSAFGPAATYVDQYFDYWEDYGHKLFAEGRWRNMWSDPRLAPEQYSAEVFEPAEALLRRALEAARTEASTPEYAERVAFLQLGLEHAQRALTFLERLGPGGTIPEDRPGFEAAREALQELIAFRRENEHHFFSDYLWPAFTENRRLDIDTLLEADIDELALRAEAGAQWLTPWESWRIRIDPHALGVQERWYKPSVATYEDWTPVRVPARLADTAVGPYLGYSWYVTHFTPLPEWEGQSLELLFEGVDEQAWIYLNGQYVGEHTVASEESSVGELWNQPFVIRIDSERITPGEANLLVVRTHASSGAAGIWRPVRLRPHQSE